VTAGAGLPTRLRWDMVAEEDSHDGLGRSREYIGKEDLPRVLSASKFI
jgi:hypothetical protein